MPEFGGGGPKPPVEYRSPSRMSDGSMVRRDDPNRPPTAFTRIRHDIADRYHGIGDRIQHTPLGRFATWLTAWREPARGAGRPAGEFRSSPEPVADVIDIHGPIVDPATLSPAEQRAREEAKGRHPSTEKPRIYYREHEENDSLHPSLDPTALQRAREDEIAGRTHPGTEDQFNNDFDDGIKSPDDTPTPAPTTPAAEGKVVDFVPKGGKGGIYRPDQPDDSSA